MSRTLTVPNAVRLAACLGALVLVAPMAEAQTAGQGVHSGFFGLLPVRDLTIYGFTRLDMRPPPAVDRPARSFVELDLGYQNTWSVSDNVSKALRERTRSPLTAKDVATLRDLPGENYLVDGEIGLLELVLDYAVTSRLDVYAILGAAQYSGGAFLDGMIERFHDAFGFPQSGRTAVPRNRVNRFYNLKGMQGVDIDQSTERGFIDPVVGMRYTLARDPNGWNWLVDTAIKIPVAEQPDFSTGRFDVGAQLSAQYFAGSHGFYASAALVVYRGSDGPLRTDAMVVPTVIVGYEFRAWPDTSLIAQFYGSRSVLDSSITDVGGLREDKYQLTLGVRQRFDRVRWSLAVTENFFDYNTTPDFGFQLGVGLDF